MRCRRCCSWGGCWDGRGLHEAERQGDPGWEEGESLECGGQAGQRKIVWELHSAGHDQAVEVGQGGFWGQQEEDGSDLHVRGQTLVVRSQGKRPKATQNLQCKRFEYHG